MRRWSGSGGVALLAVIVLLVTGCASGGAAASAPADPAQVAESAGRAGVSPELVFTTSVDGYDLAPQSVGPSNTDGMSATWFNMTTGGMLTIRTDRGSFTEEACATTILEAAPGASVTCTEEGDVWKLSAGDVHEYVAVRGDAMIRVSGVAAPSEDVRAAADAVHPPSAAELEALFSDAPTPASTPVPRGDLPENGDGAPIDPVGPGG